MASVCLQLTEGGISALCALSPRVTFLIVRVLVNTIKKVRWEKKGRLSKRKID